MTCVLLPRGAFAHGDTGRHTGRRRVMGMFLQSRSTTGFGGHHQRGEAWDGPPPEAAAGAGPADTLIPDRGLQPGRERAWSFIRAAALTPRAGGVLGRCPRLAGRADQPQQTHSGPWLGYSVLCPVPGPGRLRGPTHVLTGPAASFPCPGCDAHLCPPQPGLPSPPGPSCVGICSFNPLPSLSPTPPPALGLL